MKAALLSIAKNKILVITAIALIVTGFLMYFLLYNGYRQKINTLRNEIQNNKKVLSDLTGKEKEVNEYYQKVHEIDSQIRDIEKKVPYIMDIPSLVIEFYYILLEYGLEGTNISFGKKTSGTEFDYFTVSFSVKGLKTDVYDFINLIENYKKKVSVVKVSFKPEEDTKFSVDLTLKMYTLKDDGKTQTPEYYDFMEGKYGVYSTWYDAFKAAQKAGGNVDNLDKQIQDANVAKKILDNIKNTFSNPNLNSNAGSGN